jgi:hypothetical protein
MMNEPVEAEKYFTAHTKTRFVVKTDVNRISGVWIEIHILCMAGKRHPRPKSPKFSLMLSFMAEERSSFVNDATFSEDVACWAD